MNATETHTDEYYTEELAQEVAALEADSPVGLQAEEPPVSVRKTKVATGGPRRGKYDEEVEFLFEHPGQSYRLISRKTGEPMIFTNSAVKQGLQKKYADWTDDDGNRLIVSAVRLGEKTYGAWLKVGPVAEDAAKN